MTTETTPATDLVGPGPDILDSVAQRLVNRFGDVLTVSRGDVMAQARELAADLLAPVRPVLTRLTFQRDTAHADAEVMASLFESYRDDHLGLPDTTPVAEVHEHLLNALRELDEWCSGSRITQESSDQQDRAVRAEHALADAQHEIKRLTSALRQARAKAANASGRAVDLAGQLDRVRRALGLEPADPLTPGARVRIGECIGTVERQPRRVRVRLDGAAPATFDARFVHPVTDPAEQAAARVVEVDPPPADLTPNVQHTVNPLQIGETVRIKSGAHTDAIGTVIENPQVMYPDETEPRVRVEVTDTLKYDVSPRVSEVQRVTVLKPQED